ncbi:MAG: hypothetical protein WCF85_19080 [Rhodospirillaceae bacterium]
MKRLLPVLVILFAITATPSRADEFWRSTGQSCFFGAAVLGISAAMVLYPALISSATTLPATTLVFGNGVFGCGLGMIGTFAAHGFDALYDRLFASPPGPAPFAPPLKSRGSVT